ncbi:MAG: hypothetical protein JAY75_14910, partial [Candidatus Thiodiazotropha taylori]|nr:hypothetical protein [Candidatus Thiodiazotropha taylori]MCW4309505.1 hypothetical protein [Candidatus Thiodiazotropha endolucinida]
VGEWTVEEQDCHINVLELKACVFALKPFAKIYEIFISKYLWIIQQVVVMWQNSGESQKT